MQSRRQKQQLQNSQSSESPTKRSLTIPKIRLTGRQVALPFVFELFDQPDVARPQLYLTIHGIWIAFLLWANPLAIPVALIPAIADWNYRPKAKATSWTVDTHAEPVAEHQGTPQLLYSEEAQPYEPGPVTQLGRRQTVDVPASMPAPEPAERGGALTTTKTKTLLSQLLLSPFANRAFIGAQRTGKSGVAAVAGRSLAGKGITFYQINLACYSENGQSEDDHYTKHIHPSNSVRGDIALARDKEEVQQLVDRATSLVHDWFATRNSILIVDEWFSLASQSIDFAELTYPLAQLIAGKLAHLTSAGTKRGLAIWMITPQVKAGAMTEAGKEIKQCKLCYVAIAPGKSIQWRGDRIHWDAELFQYVKKNFPIDEPAGRLIQGEQRIGFINGDWMPLGTDSSHFEEMARAPKPALYGAQAEVDVEVDLSGFEDDIEVDLSGFEQSTEEMDKLIDGLSRKAESNPRLAKAFLCLSAFVVQLKEWGLGGKGEVTNKNISDSSWVSHWFREGALKSKGKEGYSVGINNALKWGVLERLNETTYKIILK